MVVRDFREIIMNDIEICDECGCMYVPSLPQDIKHHRWWHERLILGFKTKKLKNDEIVREDGDFYVTHITPNSPLPQRNKAELASKLAKGGLGRDAGFSYFSFRAKDTQLKDYHLFIPHNIARGIGLFVIKKETCLEAKWDIEKLTLTGKITEPIYIVDIVWIASSQRRKGIAKDTINAIARYFGIQATSLGWSTPFTESGEHLAKSICPETILIYHSGM